MQLGYVGLGNMGAALARRLLRRHKMRLYDLRPQAMARLADLGGIACQSPKALAAESDLVMTCLPTSAEVQEAIFGSDGLAAGLKKGSIIADMTTGDPNATREMADALKSAGITLIDAPVSGGPHGADAGTIAIMVGAPARRLRARATGFRNHQPQHFSLWRYWHRPYHEARQQRRGGECADGDLRSRDHGHQGRPIAGDLFACIGEGIGTQLYDRDHIAQVREGRAQNQLHARSDAQGRAFGDGARRRQRSSRCRFAIWCARSSRSL